MSKRKRKAKTHKPFNPKEWERIQLNERGRDIMNEAEIAVSELYSMIEEMGGVPPKEHKTILTVLAATSIRMGLGYSLKFWSEEGLREMYWYESVKGALNGKKNLP